MSYITMDFTNLHAFVPEKECIRLIEKDKQTISKVLSCTQEESDVLGWIDIDRTANSELINQIEGKAAEIRERADVFAVVGVGGSSRGARAAITALGDNKVEIVYTGNTLSPRTVENMLANLSGKSLYVNVIAKNFATLEPCATFQMIRHYMEDTYGGEQAAKRIIATAYPNNSGLELLGRKKGYTILPFPPDMGGRYSVLSAVGLLPIAVSGTPVRELLEGAREMKARIHSMEPFQNDAVLYAAYRNLLLNKGYGIEILSVFEPLLSCFTKWWVQLFGESEGKNGKGIFPAACCFSEDLHSMGQYIQEGRRILFETFLHLKDQGAVCPIPYKEGDESGIGYIVQKDFAFLNETAYKATVKAHSAGGVPCMIVDIPALTPYYFGQLFYFFEYSCYLSGTILGVNPFDQPGVEAYKNHMLSDLKEKK